MNDYKTRDAGLNTFYKLNVKKVSYRIGNCTLAEAMFRPYSMKEKKEKKRKEKERKKERKFANNIYASGKCI